jgi:UrcA family protein
MSNRALQVAAFATAAAMSGAASATSAVPPDAQQKSVVVHYQPSDLDSGAGAEEMYQTLHRVARFVCDDSGYTRELTEFQQIKHCEQAAIANAVLNVSNANLTTAYNRHYPNQPLVESERLSERLHALIIVVVG